MTRNIRWLPIALIGIALVGFGAPSWLALGAGLAVASVCHSLAARSRASVSGRCCSASCCGFSGNGLATARDGGGLAATEIMMSTTARILLVGAVLGCGKAAPSDLPPGAEQHQPKTMVHRFDHADQWAKVFDDPARDAWQHPDDVIAALGLAPTMTVADVGAGTGYFTVRLARAVPQGQVIATDIEPDMVRYLTERAAREHLANVRAIEATGDDPELEPGSVDRILVVDVWHHVADRTAYAKGLASALRPGGQVAIVDFTQEATHGPPREHRLKPEVIVADLKGAGLDATLAKTALPEQFIVVGTKH